MKNVLFLFVTILTVISGYSQTPTYPSPCPPGTCPQISWEIETFNFHKPRTGCNSGFGLCIKIGPGTVQCNPCQLYSPATISTSTGKATMKAKLVDNSLELHIPIGLSTDAGYNPEEFNLFYVENATQDIYFATSYIGKLKGGTYKVKKTEKEYVVLVDFE